MVKFMMLWRYPHDFGNLHLDTELPSAAICSPVQWVVHDLSVRLLPAMGEAR